MVQWEKLEKKLIRTVGKNLKESDRQTREKPLKGGVVWHVALPISFLLRGGTSRR